MTKKNFKELATNIIDCIGGKANVTNCIHCYTRLRFNLKDNGLANLEKIKNLSVIGAQFSGEQLQIIIGYDVTDVYKEVCSQLDIKETEALEVNEDGDLGVKQKVTFKSVVNSIIDGIVGCVVPTIPILVGSGVIQAIILILENLNVVTAENPTVITLTYVANAAFYFLPIFVAFFGAKKFGGNPALGAMLGAVLVHPTLVEMVNAGDAGSVFGISIYAASYSSTIVPAILSVYVMSLIEKQIAKYSPKVLKSILEPTLTLIIMTPLTLCILAPLGAILSGWFADAIMWFYGIFGAVAVGLLTAIIPIVVMLGMHIGTVPFSVQMIASTGSDPIMMPAFFISNFAQGAACLGVGIKTKDKDLKSFAFTSAFSDIVPGISEPGMYGITLKYKTPMYAAMIGSFAGGLYFGIMSVGAQAFVPPNIFAITSYIANNPSNIINAIIGVVITMVVTFVMTMILYKDEAK